MHYASFKDRLQSQLNSTIIDYKGKCVYGLYDRLNRWVFKCFLKVGSVFAEVTHAGRLFHRRGAATPKTRSPAVDSRDLLMTSLLNEAERSRVLAISSAAHCRSSAKYWGAVLFIQHLNTRTANRNLSRSGMRSQCSSFFKQRSDTVVLATAVNQSCCSVEHWL